MTAVGFTGTRGSLPLEQQRALADVVTAQFVPGSPFHHGDCVGADELAHNYATATGYRVHVWPPLNRKFRAYCTGDVMHRPMMYSRRNLAIVEHASVLVATPAGPEQDWPRSGTWMTVRMARRLGVPRIIIYPDGAVSTDGR